ncbi:hypothetical protein [Geomonas agri]|uniref:hypothetical protein n=1 Tax=Geomonas agri TaxID=2873702 RepID=UPI001CD3A957|nr:hypothetical protein [Geomonas agri]
MISRPGTGKDAILFYVSLAALTVASVWPIWASRLLPMQDYPQHLFLAQVMATYHDPSYNWQEFYRIDLGVRPYMLWYLAMKVLTLVCAVETAGKILFSLYILLMGLLALVARRLAPPSGYPWGSLLLFPFAFNQMYFLGFPNFVLSLPLIFLALLDLDALAAGPSVGRVARHGMYLILLFLIHPYSLLVYIALSATPALTSIAQRKQLLRTLLPAAVMAVVIGVWYMAQHGPSATPTSVPWSVRWLVPHRSLAFYLLQFTGMRIIGGPDWSCVMIWVVVAVVFDMAWRRRTDQDTIDKRFLAWFAASLVGIFVLPFWMGYYSYFNLRLAPVSYFSLALLLCCLRIPFRHAALLTVCALALLIQSIRLQHAVAFEKEAILPVAAVAQKNSLVLPLVYRSDSPFLDPYYFNEIHSHDAEYYQMFAGGGATPTLFPNAMMPVQYQPGVVLPYPKKPADFSWERYGTYYDYLLVRSAPGSLYPDLFRYCDLVAKSGPWEVFKNRTARKSQ